MLAFCLVLLTTPLAAEAFLEVVNKVADSDWDCTTGVAKPHRTNEGNGVSEAKCRKLAQEGTKGGYVWYHESEHCYVYESHSLDSNWKDTQMEKDKNGNPDSNWKTCKWAAKERTVRLVSPVSEYNLCFEVTMTNCDTVLDEFKKQGFEDGTCAEKDVTMSCGEASQNGKLPCSRSVDGNVDDKTVQCTMTVVQDWALDAYVDNEVLKNFCPKLSEVAVGDPRNYQLIAKAMQEAVFEETTEQSMMAAVEETHTTSMAVMGFAAFGLSVVLYGSYKHYFEKN